MNKREQLLVDTLGESEGAEFARLAAARIRRRRTIRQLGVGVGAACLLAAVAFVSRPQRVAPAPEVAIAPPQPAIEIMSDQELLAQLRDQPVLILKSDNRVSGVVFLEAGTKL